MTPIYTGSVLGVEPPPETDGDDYYEEHDRIDRDE